MCGSLGLQDEILEIELSHIVPVQVPLVSPQKFKPPLQLLPPQHQKIRQHPHKNPTADNINSRQKLRIALYRHKISPNRIIIVIDKLLQFDSQRGRLIELVPQTLEGCGQLAQFSFCELVELFFVVVAGFQVFVQEVGCVVGFAVVFDCGQALELGDGEWAGHQLKQVLELGVQELGIPAGQPGEQQHPIPRIPKLILLDIPLALLGIAIPHIPNRNISKKIIRNNLTSGHLILTSTEIIIDNLPLRQLFELECRPIAVCCESAAKFCASVIVIGIGIVMVVMG